jgi:hypothetical protein
VASGATRRLPPGATHARPVARASACAGLVSYPCPPAAVLRTASVLPAAQSRGQEDGASGDRHRLVPRVSSAPPAIVLPSARLRGWEDRQRASARWQEGMCDFGRNATPAAGCDARQACRARVGVRGSRQLPVPSCRRAAHGVCPPSRASARPGGRCFWGPSSPCSARRLGTPRDRPPSRACARPGGRCFRGPSSPCSARRLGTPRDRPPVRATARMGGRSYRTSDGRGGMRLWRSGLA